MKDPHTYLMSKAIKIGKSNPMAPYGSIITYGDDVIVQSVNSANKHPLMHGELSVIHKLFENGFDGDTSMLTLYTTAEPCAMCAAAIYWAKIPKVVYGSSIPFLHNLFGRQIQIRAETILRETPEFYKCTLIGGVLEKECNELFLQAQKKQAVAC